MKYHLDVLMTILYLNLNPKKYHLVDYWLAMQLKDHLHAMMMMILDLNPNVIQ